ncbi:MAG: DUF2971 domain-containing protein [Clostridiales bacterium]|nr:DUF2971 domain-containing protein [Clostridiales bacterium]
MNGSKPNVVYHYCSVSTFFNILTSSKLRLSNVMKSNDPEESIYLVRFLLRALEKQRKIFNESIGESEYNVSEGCIQEIIDRYFNTYNPARLYCAICFSEAQNKLSQWVKYADNVQGVALGFDTEILNSITDSPFFFFDKVIYDEKVIFDRIDALFGSLFSNVEWLSSSDKNKRSDFENTVYRAVTVFNRYAPFYKDKFFEEEQEWRLVFNPNGNINRVSTKDFPDFEVVRNGNIGEMAYSGIYFDIKNNDICSYMELDFSRIKRKFLKEIIIAPKAAIEKLDGNLLLFLKNNDYEWTERNSLDKLKIIKIDRQRFH